MRYGIVRMSAALPSLQVQRRGIEVVGCDVILEERPPNLASQKVLFHLLDGLVAGDEVLVHALSALEATTGELTLLLRRFFEVGVTLRVTGGSVAVAITPDGAMPRSLSLLADHEAARPTRPPARRRGRTRDAPLTQHQIRFARDLHRRGHSMRAIGLIFQLAPNEMAALIRAPNGRSPPRPDAGHREP
ncbi:MAG: hypothetical protein U1C74_24760 [Phenylobacterium sp.]|nr:hypothetical protein [Phenylobacterium sp.]